jgi:hypothetical protein
MKKAYKIEAFTGSTGWLIFWILVFWPIALYYYFSHRELVSTKK